MRQGRARLRGFRGLRGFPGRHGLRGGGGLVAVAAVTGVLAALVPGTGLSAGQPAGHRVATAGGPADVGALFTASGGHPRQHFCTASVVHSPAGNLLITAAHCVTQHRYAPAGSVVFAPGYHDGRFPFGLWPVAATFVSPGWATRRDPNDDVAFLAVRDQGRRELESRTGADTLAIGQQPPLTARVIGYPDSSARPLRCLVRARAFTPGSLRQLTFACPRYTEGTSGGPFLARYDTRTGTGLVVGVIGGYQQGGDTAGVSYSAQFGRQVAELYLAAIRADRPSAAGR